MTAEIVPFGKHKGQPVEVLLADQDYLGWLVGQPWFRDRFPNIYQVVVNYGAEPRAETPEHNELQASFLDDARCMRLAHLLYPRWSFGPDDAKAALTRSRDGDDQGISSIASAST